MSQETLNFSPYLKGLIDEYGLPTDESLHSALESISLIDPQSPTAPETLLKLKERFALAWSEKALCTKTDFKTLGLLQSKFADLSIDMALQIAWNIETKPLKLPKHSGHLPGLFILGLGKLGGLDLNFSSDVDLVAFYNPEKLLIPENIGWGYAVNKILKTMSQILKPRNSPSFIWRVDWRLRPESSSTQLAISMDMAQDFYFFRALPWHRLALMKARVIAGDKDTGQAFLNTITPFIWRQNLDFRALDELAHLKSRINLEHPALRFQRESTAPITDKLSRFNVKLGAGGIREIEFIANAKQLIWGGKQYDLRTPNTLDALKHLAHLGYLEAPVSEQLQAHYIHLRKLENAIQMLDNQQTHIAPQSQHSIDNLLGLLKQEDWQLYSQNTTKIRQFVNEEFSKTFRRNDGVMSETNAFNKDLETLSESTSDIAKSWLEGFALPQTNTKNKFKFQSLGRYLLKLIFETSASPETAIHKVNDFFLAISRSDQYLHLLSYDHKLLNSLIPPLLYSQHMSVLLKQSPHIIDAFLSPTPDMSTEFIFKTEDYETRLERLRRFVNETLYLTYADFMSPKGTSAKMHGQLTKLADKTMQAALDIVADDLGLPTLPMCVLGLGKMGTSRMAPQSDLDLIFIFKDDTDTDDAHKIVRRLRTVLTAKLTEGIAYELDMRLRPSGRSGPPAVMQSTFEDHHKNRAHNWEHIALVHSRIVAGNSGLGNNILAIRDAVLARPRDTAQFLADAHTMWQRISEQRLSDTPPSKFNSKLRHGGLMQAEYSEACAAILGEDIMPLSQPIAHWSHIQLWERLLGLTEQPLLNTPEFYQQNLLDQLGCKSLSELAEYQHQNTQIVTSYFDKIIAKPHEYNEPEGRITWKN